MKIPSKKWQLYLETHSRAEALYMADFLARAVEPKFFHDPDDVPLFIVTGGFNYGKSMICEAMSRSILDQESVAEMVAEGQRFHHYLETAPSTALTTYCFQLGTIDGKPGAVSFDRITEMSLQSNRSLYAKPHQKKNASLLDIFDRPHQNNQMGVAERMYQEAFRKHTTIYKDLKEGYGLTENGPVSLETGKSTSLSDACRKQMRVGGAIFSSGHVKPDVTPWIHFTVDQPHYADTFLAGKYKGKKLDLKSKPAYDENDPNHPKWHKEWNIVVLSSKLQNSPRFQKFWETLQAYAQKRDLYQRPAYIDLKTFDMK